MLNLNILNNKGKVNLANGYMWKNIIKMKCLINYNESRDIFQEVYNVPELDVNYINLCIFMHCSCKTVLEMDFILCKGTLNSIN